ncbi:polygalacturonase-like protein [Populus alba x Populus x berolinensis]|nr:polygalacturonase-like protein [Populus alba x Populus x berolinensis]
MIENVDEKPIEACAIIMSGIGQFQTHHGMDIPTRFSTAFLQSNAASASYNVSQFSLEQTRMAKLTQRNPFLRHGQLHVAQLLHPQFVRLKDVICSRQQCLESITFNWANDILISGLTSINSQSMHLVINSCNNVLVRNVRVIAPDQSPNTDGIHVQTSTGVTITGSTLQTGDDCISIGPSTRNLLMSSIKCGPGHGISIGSLGKEFNEDGVENITLTYSIFSGSDNGVRIKSWARPSNGFVRNVVFQNLIMKNV